MNTNKYARGLKTITWAIPYFITRKKIIPKTNNHDNDIPAISYSANI